MRRGEVQFVAVRVGRSNDPRECLGLAAALKCSRATALGYVVLWEELILEVGDAEAGRVKGYAAKHIAAKLGYEGSPAKLVDALKEAGLLSTHKGTFVHPYWRESVTGHYVREKARRREFERLKKQEQRDLVPGTSPGTTMGRPHAVPGTSLGNPDTNQGKDVPGTAPPTPREDAGVVGAARWEWLKEHHNRPMNPRACIGYLGAMSEVDWALVQWLAPLTRGGAPRSLSRKKRVLGLDTHRLLSHQAYLQILPEWREKLRADQRPAEAANGAGNGHAEKHLQERADDVAARLASATLFVLAQLSDPELTDSKKEKIRERWRTQHPDAAPPWEPLQEPAATH